MKFGGSDAGADSGHVETLRPGQWSTEAREHVLSFLRTEHDDSAVTAKTFAERRYKHGERIEFGHKRARVTFALLPANRERM